MYIYQCFNVNEECKEFNEKNFSDKITKIYEIQKGNMFGLCRVGKDYFFLIIKVFFIFFYFFYIFFIFFFIFFD